MGRVQLLLRCDSVLVLHGERFQLGLPDCFASRHTLRVQLVLAGGVVGSTMPAVEKSLIGAGATEIRSLGMSELRTPRLLLRQWRQADLEPFAALNGDPEVMRHFPSPLTRAESDALAEREAILIGLRGWGLWAAEVTKTNALIGFIGLAEPGFDAHFTPAVEIGWRLARRHWGKGYATEGARRALAFGFDDLGLEEIVSFTTVANTKSQSVMERIGMTHDPADDFEHPLLPPGDPLRPHVLYRVRRRT